MQKFRDILFEKFRYRKIKDHIVLKRFEKNKENKTFHILK